MTKEDRYKNELSGVLAKITKPSLAKEFLEDLLSPREFNDIAKRLQIVKQLAQGVSQRAIARDLNIGIATVTRGSIELQDKKGGFRKILNKFYKQ
jgi:TrpR family transcriptional regulator, trp operon repressor